MGETRSPTPASGPRGIRAVKPLSSSHGEGDPPGWLVRRFPVPSVTEKEARSLSSGPYPALPTCPLPVTFVSPCSEPRLLTGSWLPASARLFLLSFPEPLMLELR